MKLIPVIDLMGGMVVHAVRGDRANYRAIRSPLCTSSYPEHITEALLRLHPFTTLYIADLDAIQRKGDNIGTVAAIHRRFPELSLWVDAGFHDDASLASWLAHDLGRPVIGSESIVDAGLLGRAQLCCLPILSLDYRGDTFIGPAGLAEDPAPWPQQVIAMTLARVGSNTGPDLPLLRQLLQRGPGHHIHAAGGVRNAEDLAALAELGVAGVLLASALHNGSLAPADLMPYA